MTNEDDYTVIFMTGRIPLRIVSRDWPIISRAEQDLGSGGIVYMRVRQHSDGRRIVYGVKEFDDKDGYRVLGADGYLLEKDNDSGSSTYDAVLNVIKGIGYPGVGRRVLMALPPQELK